MEEKGIIPIVMGGLGNQMFIVAAAYVGHRHTNLPLYLLQNRLENNKHNHKKRNYNETIFKEFGIKLQYTENNPEFIEKGKQLGYRGFCHQQSGFLPWYPDSVFPGALFSNYFQYYPPLAPYKDELRLKFIKGIEEFRTTLNSKYTNLEKSAFLHIRRGDYIDIPHIHYNQTLDYYKKAVETLININPTIQTIYIVSDDIAWAKQQPYFQSPIFTFFESDDELETLALMSLCIAGSICANSTFSWWGAFLGSYEKRNPVIVPSKWISDQVYSLFPDEWILI